MQVYGTQRQTPWPTLQGVKYINSGGHMEIRLTDPAIHCPDKDYFTGNMAAARPVHGFEKFMDSHLDLQIEDIVMHGEICDCLLPRCKALRWVAAVGGHAPKLTSTAA